MMDKNESGNSATPISTDDFHVIEAVKKVFKGWDVKRAILHQGFPLPGGGDTTTSMYAQAGQTGVGKASGRSGISMKYSSDGLFCEYKGYAFIIPLANVVGVYL